MLKPTFEHSDNHTELILLEMQKLAAWEAAITAIEQEVANIHQPLLTDNDLLIKIHTICHELMEFLEQPNQCGFVPFADIDNISYEARQQCNALMRRALAIIKKHESPEIQTERPAQRKLLSRVWAWIKR